MNNVCPISNYFFISNQIRNKLIFQNFPHNAHESKPPPSPCTWIAQPLNETQYAIVIPLARIFLINSRRLRGYGTVVKLNRENYSASGAAAFIRDKRKRAKKDVLPLIHRIRGTVVSLQTKFSRREERGGVIK